MLTLLVNVQYIQQSNWLTPIYSFLRLYGEAIYNISLF